MSESQKISVVMSVYGQFNLERARISVQSALVQKGLDLEVVVSEEGETPKFPEIPGVKYVFSYYKPKSSLSDFNTGNVRNRAINLATGEFIYTNDADVIFTDTNYLAKVVDALKKDPKKIFYRPRMRRLHINDFEEFERTVDEVGIEKAVSKLDYSQEYIVTTDGKFRRVEVFKKNSIYPKTFTAFGEDFDRYVSDKSLNGSEPLIWNENRHGGGNLFRRTQFYEVGGYSSEFINWGCEDSDLQWKFSQIYDLQFFPEGFEVIHLDHPKAYFNAETWKRNETISKKRVGEGVTKAIQHDKETLWNL
jgi:hypothetical protein